jgi:hypothetical protein
LQYPSYFDDVAPIRLYDPLADFLGAVEGGEMQIGFRDCVVFAGHACPTVAGAYLMARTALSILYPETLPRRSEIGLELSGAEDEGVVGVVGGVIAYIVGAGGAGGFKGMGGRYARNDRIAYGVAFDGDVRLTRLDTGAYVALRYDASAIPGDRRMKPLMQKALRGEATPQEEQLFRTLWQERTRAIVLSRDPSSLITITSQGETR